MAGTGHQIFMVWAPGYQTLGTKCEAITETLQLDTSYRASYLVNANATTFYQPMSMVQFVPTRSHSG